MFRTLLACITVFVASLAHAEVIELDGTIKSLDHDSRAISIVRKTPKGQKVLDLEVAKNAGDIDSLKVGDKISFAYNPDAEIVTKIEKGLSKEAASDVKALQGEWKNTYTEEGGKRLEPADLRRINRTLLIKGDSLRMERVLNDKFGFHEGEFRIDPDKRLFDLEEPSGLIWVGIYELRGDKLKLCYRVFKKGTPPKERPAEFSGIGENAPLNYEYKRVNE